MQTVKEMYVGEILTKQSTLSLATQRVIFVRPPVTCRSARQQLSPDFTNVTIFPTKL